MLAWTTLLTRRKFTRVLSCGVTLLVAAVVLGTAGAMLIRHRPPTSAYVAAWCLAGIVVAITVLWTFWISARRTDDRTLTYIGLAVIAFSFVCRLVWVAAVDAHQVSDFGSYLACGCEYWQSEPSQWAFCNGVTWERSVFYTLPLCGVFGPSLVAVEIVNVLLLTLAALWFFLAGRVLFGPRLATTSLLFFIWHPDLWYSVTLASHDVPGTFWMALVFLLVAWLQHRVLRTPDSPRAWIPVFLIAAALGIVLMVVDFQRSYHFIAIPSLGLLALAQAWRVIRGTAPKHGERHGLRRRLGTSMAQIAALFLLPLVSYAVSKHIVVGQWSIDPGQRSGGSLADAGAIDVLYSGDEWYRYGWRVHHFHRLPPERQLPTSVKKVLHDVTDDPLAFAKFIIRKHQVFSDVDGGLHFASDGPSATYDLSGQVGYTTAWARRLLRSQARTLHGLLMLLLAWRLLRYPRRGYRLQHAFPLLFSALFYAVMLVLYNTQARYDVFLVFAFSWLAAEGWADLWDRGWRGLVPTRPTKETLGLYGAGLALLFAGAGCFAGVAALVRDTRVTLRDQSGFVPITDQPVTPGLQSLDLAPSVILGHDHRKVAIGYRAATAVPAGSIIGAQRVFQLAGERPEYVSFFLCTQDYVRRHPWDVDIEYAVVINEKLVARGRLGNSPTRFFDIDTEKIPRSETLLVQLYAINHKQVDATRPRWPVIALEYLDFQ